jgi:hypothetical protein
LILAADFVGQGIAHFKIGMRGGLSESRNEEFYERQLSDNLTESNSFDFISWWSFAFE